MTFSSKLVTIIPSEKLVKPGLETGPEFVIKQFLKTLPGYKDEET